jgi:hypothetical protein
MRVQGLMSISYNPMGKIRRAIRDDPIILAHHPFCDNFAGHTIQLRGYSVCLGCLFTYPSAGVTIAVVLAIGYLGLPFTNIQLFGAGVMLFAVALLRKALDIGRENQRLHIIFRVVLGVSLGLVLSAIIVSPDWTSRLVLLAIIAGVAITYNVLNGRRTMGICRSCEQYPEFPKCDGSRP